MNATGSTDEPWPRRTSKVTYTRYSDGLAFREYLNPPRAPV
ncbi:hypothetical protein [Micromonospora sp. WMMD1082]|nr:hypothetical protein [Micromonospora sp. WMMD1082]MDG4795530.1 hypothetical protein [Micromonospora sp. WMMD1082]